MEKYRNKYRTASARASWWDYGSNAAYFVTNCTQDWVHFFCEIAEDKMELSELGTHAQSCWFANPYHFPFVKLGASIVMLNHIHGIIIIDKSSHRPSQMPSL